MQVWVYILIVLCAILLVTLGMGFLFYLRGRRQSFRYGYLTGVKAFVDAVEAKNPRTKGHSERVSEYATLIAQELGMKRWEIALVRDAALVHDVGKISLPEDVVTSKGVFEPAQQAAMMTHPVLGYEILERSGASWELLLPVRHHHEWYGGGGYPDGLSGDEIPLVARILAVADAFEAMTQGRSFRERLSLEEAMRGLASAKGSQFDPRIVDAFLRVLNRGEVTIKVPEVAAPAEGDKLKVPLARLPLPWTLGMLTSTQYKASTILFRLGQEIRSILDLRTLLERILSLLIEVQGYRNYAIFLKDEAGDLVMEAAKGCREAQRGARIQEGGGVVGWVAEHQVARLIPNVASDPSYLESSFFRAGTMIVAPLATEGKVVGVLVMESEIADGFTSDDLHLIETIAPHIATVIEVAQLHRKVRMDALYDSLTGVYNHRYFYERLGEELARSRRYGRPVSLAILDVDGLKTTNDIYGHLAGDQALKKIGYILRENVRGSDVVARYGGDEFAIIMPETGKEEAINVIKRLMVLLDGTVVQHQAQLFPMPTRSYGVVTFPQDGSNPTDLFAAADHLLYQAKSKRHSPI